MLSLIGLLMAASPPPEGDRVPLTVPACAAAEGEQITVCADRLQRSPYRIDPAIAAVDRKRADPGVRPSGHQHEKAAPCPSYGFKLCAGVDTIPILAIARVAASSALLAARGEDWRSPLRTEADHYEEYRAEKARQERRSASRKARIGIGVGR